MVGAAGAVGEVDSGFESSGAITVPDGFDFVAEPGLVPGLLVGALPTTGGTLGSPRDGGPAGSPSAARAESETHAITPPLTSKTVPRILHRNMAKLLSKGPVKERFTAGWKWLQNLNHATRR
jgi:hypothetical protein